MNIRLRPLAPLAIAIAFFTASGLINPTHAHASALPTDTAGSGEPTTPSLIIPTLDRADATRLSSISNSIQHVFIFNLTDSAQLAQSSIATSWLSSQFGNELREGAVVWVRYPGDASLSVSGLPGGVDTERFPGGSVSGVTADLQSEGFARRASYVYNIRDAGFRSSSQADLSRLTPVGMQLWSRSGSSSPDPTPTPPKGAPSPAPVPSPSPPPNGIPVSGVTVLRQMTFESGEQPETTPQAPSGGVGTTTDAARSGSRAGYSLLRPGDSQVSNGGYRAEWHGGDHARSGDERWNGISFYLPDDFDQGYNSRTWNDRIIYQFTDDGAPMFSLHLSVDREEMWLRRKLPNRDSNGDTQYEVLGRWNVQAERWYDIVFHAEWSKDSSGVFEAWVNGQQEVDYSGRTLAVRSSTSVKWGIYGQPTKIYYDNVWMAEGNGTFRGR